MSETRSTGPAAARFAPAPTGLEPWEAVCWSAVIPGLAHALLGRRGTGAWIAAMAIACMVLAAFLMVHPGVPLGWCVLPFLAVLGVEIAAGFDAYRIAHAAETPGEAAARRGVRDPWKALLLTRVAPGLGHMYDGRYFAAIGWLAGSAVMALLPGGFALIRELMLVPLASLDLWRAFRGRASVNAAGMQRVVLAAVTIALAVLAQTWILRATFVRAFRSPSESMTPTLAVGDCFFADVTRHGRANRGDVVIMRFPQNPKTDFVKRVFGVAGDVVEFRPDGAWCNRRRVHGPPVLPPGSSQPPLAGAGHPFRVPPGTVFVTGDNLANSLDSRYLGPVPLSSVRGRATKIYWPLAHSGPLPKWPPATR